MKQQIRLNEEELKNLISECVQEVLNEENNERNIFTNTRDAIGAIKDTFTKGGNYQAHKNYRNMQTSKNDINKLNQKYGVTNDAMNTKQMATSMASGDVEKLEAEKQQAIQQVAQKYDAKIAAAKQKAGERAQQYRDKRTNLNTQRNQSRNNMRKAMNTNPYAGYTQNSEE